VSLICSKVLDEMRLGLVDEDEEVQAVTDRSYWEARASRHTLAMADEMLEVVRALDPDLELNPAVRETKVRASQSMKTGCRRSRSACPKSI
jgi:hypothetical protein